MNLLILLQYYSHHQLVQENERQQRLLKHFVDLQTDNEMITILKNYFGLQFESGIRRMPKEKDIPPRNVILSIQINNREYTRKDIIEEGVDFYERIRNTFNNEDNVEINQQTLIL